MSESSEVKVAVANVANPGDELIEMAQAHFRELIHRDLTDAEKNLLQAVPNGEMAQCGPSLVSETDSWRD